MFITNCFAYTNITAELSRDKESFALAIKDKDSNSIHLTLNYLQTKVLTEGLTALINQTPIENLRDIEYKNILGDIRVEFDATQFQETKMGKGGKEVCQLNILPVPMANVSLSEIA